jgi:hypothetical protein
MQKHPHLNENVNRMLVISLNAGLCARDESGLLTLTAIMKLDPDSVQKMIALDEIRTFANQYRRSLMTYVARPSRELGTLDQQALFILDMCRNAIRNRLVWNLRILDIPTCMELVDFDESIALAAIHLWQLRLPPGDEIVDEVNQLRKAA